MRINLQHCHWCGNTHPLELYPVADKISQQRDTRVGVCHDTGKGYIWTEQGGPQPKDGSPYELTRAAC